MSAPVVACPSCGSDVAIWARADIHWQAFTQSWEIKEVEQAIDCMECDHEFPLPKDWPHPVNG